MVPRQAEAGTDIVNDGELGKVSYARYAARRLSGSGGRGEVATLTDLEDFPGWRDRILPPSQDSAGMPACIGPVRYARTAELEAGTANLLAATPACARPGGIPERRVTRAFWRRSSRTASTSPRRSACSRSPAR